MRQLKKVYISLLLVLVFLAISVSPSLADNTQIAYSKIPEDLLTSFTNTDSRLDVVVWLEDEATEQYQTIVDNIPEPVFSEGGFDSTEYSLQSITQTELTEEERLAQIEEMQNYIMQKRNIARAVYLAHNNEIAAELESEMGEGSVVYVSQYSPLIICNVNLSEAVDIAMNSCVNKLSNSSASAKDELQYSLPTVGLGIQNTAGNATLIKIGMIENGVPDVSRPCFEDIGGEIVTLKSNTTDHASMVAGIITNALTEFDTLYCTSFTSATEFYIQIEELLSCGVNVINMSAGFKYNCNCNYDCQCNDCKYDDFAKWVDHIAYNHSVHFVKSAGNSGADKVSSPGMAYNAITVGNIDDKNNIYTLDDEIVSSSSYNNTYNNLAFKPDLCAPGHLIDIPNDSNFIGYNEYNMPYDMETQGTGTSFSTPHVTAVIAALCSEYPQLLRTKQALMKSILMTSVATITSHNYSTMTNSSGSVDVGFRQYGSGIVNAHNAKTIVDSGKYVNGSITASEDEDVISLGTLEGGKKVIVTLTYLKRSRFTNTNHNLDSGSYVSSDLPDLDLFLCPAMLFTSGCCSKTTSHIKSVTRHNNVEKIIFTPQATDEYVICIDKVTNQDPYEILYAVSWMVVDTNTK